MFADLVATTLEICAHHHVSLAELLDRGLADSKPELQPEPEAEVLVRAA